ncbi:terminase large subunit domain-containing protein [Oceanibacterium hippocampi]|uniref:Terminase-like family protein n=1 Tax=Oceanibacterium hippocampi TaxID=745714 RepID=A0A1Y5TZR5_9PROT|nr:terminase family protein [Oceanibacterium hippocampi]SLN77371.1 Terminase-like family protein [Oceanibacterium hippocampi]
MLASDIARALDAGAIMREAGMPPDPWQSDVLNSTAKRQLLLCCRQSGKSTVSAAKGLQKALYLPNSLTLLLSPSLRQSGELFLKTMQTYNALHDVPPVARESALRVEFANGSRIVSLPGSDDTVRGYSAPALVIADEAAFCSEALISAVVPMLAVSDGELIAVSTPNGRQGWFYEAWTGDDDWKRTEITWKQCPRIKPEFVEMYKKMRGELICRQEFDCEFLDTDESVFPTAIIDAAFSADVVPLWQ